MALALCGQVLIIKSLNLKLDFGVVALFLLPSFLIWNNGLLKESMIVFLLGLIVYSVLINRYYFIFSIPLLILFKMPLGFLAIVFTPILVLSAYKTKFLYLITGALGLFLLHFLVPQYSPIAVIQNIQTDFINFSQYIQSGSIIPVPDLSKSWLLYPFFAIWGLFNSFFAPFPHHFNGVVNLFVIAENFFVLGLISVATYKLLIAKAKVHSNFIFLLLFVLVYLSILGIITPVAGTLVRYKSPFVFLILAILYKLLSENNLLNFQWKKNSIIK
jgi:hypothetical protein